MKRSILLLALLPLMGAVGCQKETSASETESPLSIHEKPVKIHTSLADSQNATKAIVQGTDIPENFSYGLFVCTETNKQEAHKANSWNLKSTYAKNLEGAFTWSFQYVDNFEDGKISANTYDHITITSRDDHAKANLYAYAPHIEGKFNPTAIPISIASRVQDQADLMYAVENTDPTKNKNLDPEPDDVDVLEADFTFKHALALLVFDLRIKNIEGSDNDTRYSVTKITLSSSTANLYESRTFDATTGEFNDGGTRTEKIEVDVSQNDVYISTNREYNLVMIPTQIEDDDLVVEFTINRMTTKPFVIKKEYVRHGESDEYGFKSGFKYTFHLTLDNYLYLDCLEIGKWDDEINYFNQEI